jgi:small subunit ribosomal protein S20
MPHLKSAVKRMRQSAKRRDHNRAIKRAIKKQLKSVLAVAGDKSAAADQLAKEVKVAVKALDKAASKRVIHRNTAARKKSQLARLIASRSQPAQ